MNTFLEEAAKAWNVHEHKDELHVSAENTIYHLEKGQLCWFERPGEHSDFQGYYLIAHPVRFKDAARAHAWIREGCIAQIQEGLCCLHVDFSVHSIQWIER